MSRRPLQVGDLCTTVRSRYAVLNDGRLVVIAATDPGVRDYKGVAVPYLIHRVDRQAFPLTHTFAGKPNFYKVKRVWASARHLKRVNPRGNDARDQVVTVIAAKT